MERLIPASRLASCLLLQAAAEVMNEPGLAPRIARRVDRLVVVLDQTLSVCEGAFLLGDAGRREEKDLRLDLLRDELAGSDLGRVVPERRRLRLDHIAYDKPAKLRERSALESRVRGADGGVLPHDEEPSIFPSAISSQ